MYLLCQGLIQRKIFENNSIFIMFAISLVCPTMFNMQAYKHQQFYYVILDFAGIYVKGTVC